METNETPSKETPQYIDLDEMQYPRPKESVIIPLGGPMNYPLQDGLYPHHPTYATRYIIGEDYQGSELPPGTREVLHMFVYSNDGKFTPTAQILAYCKVSHPTHSVWDRVIGYSPEGFSVMQANGNEGKMMIEGEKGARELTPEEKREIEERLQGIRGKLPSDTEGKLSLVKPRFEALKTETLPLEPANPDLLIERLGSAKTFEPIST